MSIINSLYYCRTIKTEGKLLAVMRPNFFIFSFSYVVCRIGGQLNRFSTSLFVQCPPYLTTPPPPSTSPHVQCPPNPPPSSSLYVQCPTYPPPSSTLHLPLCPMSTLPCYPSPTLHLPLCPVSILPCYPSPPCTSLYVQCPPYLATNPPTPSSMSSDHPPPSSSLYFQCPPYFVTPPSIHLPLSCPVTTLPLPPPPPSLLGS